MRRSAKCECRAGLGGISPASPAERVSVHDSNDSGRHEERTRGVRSHLQDDRGETSTPQESRLGVPSSLSFDLVATSLCHPRIDGVPSLTFPQGFLGPKIGVPGHLPRVHLSPETESS